MNKTIKIFAATCSLGLITLPAMAGNNHMNHNPQADKAETGRVTQGNNPRGSTNSTLDRSAKEYGPAKTGDAISGQIKDVEESVDVVKQMRKDKDIAKLLDNCKGVLIVPDYVAAALIAGGEGGEGVLLAHNNGKWSNPVFYDIGGVSIGAQAGVSAGSIAFILMSNQAVDSFMGDNTFSLNAEAGLSLFNWSARGHGEIGQGDDVVMWTDTEGLMAKASVGASDITWDDDENTAYYGSGATARAIIAGDVKNPHQKPLQVALENGD